MKKSTKTVACKLISVFEYPHWRIELRKKADGSFLLKDSRESAPTRLTRKAALVAYIENMAEASFTSNPGLGSLIETAKALN